MPPPRRDGHQGNGAGRVGRAALRLSLALHRLQIVREHAVGEGDVRRVQGIADELRAGEGQERHQALFGTGVEEGLRHDGPVDADGVAQEPHETGRCRFAGRVRHGDHCRGNLGGGHVTGCEDCLVHGIGLPRGGLRRR